MTLLLLTALILDEVFGELKRFHPLLAFGRYVSYLEKTFYTHSNQSQFLAGIFCWCLAVIPLVLLTTILMWLCHIYFSEYVYWFINAVILYFTIGQKSLRQHAYAVYEPLLSADSDTKKLNQARTALSMIVSRDTQAATPSQMATATIETVTENTHDAIIGPMIFLIIFGAPGAVLFRLTNTLDAMWGYRTERYEQFGKWSARTDDVLGYLPARITAFLMVLSSSMKCIATIKSIWFTGRPWYSPNAGIVMAAGAGALGIKLGGDAVYQGKRKSRLELGLGRSASMLDIKRSIILMYLTSGLLIICVGVLEYFFVSYQDENTDLFRLVLDYFWINKL
jgi:adenosylcobinamide-phosphate synthase